MKISACIITKNEERNIEKCINSFKDVCSEIILTDSGSEDRTIELAKALGATIYEITWIGDFSYAKNYGIERAKGDWILIVDADEYFDPPLNETDINFIKEINEKEEIDGILNFRYNLENKEGKLASINPEVRLIKNGRGIKYIDKVHEHLVTKAGFGPNCIETDTMKLMHTGYTLEEGTGKAERNLKILLAMDDNENDPCRRLGYLAESYLGVGDNENAILYSDKMINHEKFEHYLFLTQKGFRVYVFKIMAMFNLPEKYSLSDIAVVINRSVDDFGKHPEIRFLSGFYHYKCEKYKKAIEDIEYAFELHKNYDLKNYLGKFENDFSAKIDEKYALLGRAYELNKNPIKAAKKYKKCLEINPTNEDILLRLFYVCTDEEAFKYIKEDYEISTEKNLMCAFSSALTARKKNIVFYILPIIMKRYPQALAGRQDLLDVVQEIANT